MIVDAIVGHLVGDYLAQNDTMASQKKTNSWWCLLHCLIWTGLVFCFNGGDFGLLGVMVLFCTHFIQDRTQIIKHYMDFVGQKSFRTGPLAPWSSVVVDNTWHIVTIWLVCTMQW